ncbi:cytochrome c biogenesis protein ResB [Nakamurella sp. GG22]
MTVRDTTHVGSGGLLDAEPDGTAPAADGSAGPRVRRQNSLGRAGAMVRNLWRQLTSMRTALILLFLLALASLPGALLPQWSLNSAKTGQYILDHPTIGPWLDRFGFFEVFASPWYAAIYLLLFVSLIGCLLPRTIEFAGQVRMPPVATPRNLFRLPHHYGAEVAGSPGEVADRITTGLRGWRIARRTEQRPGAGGDAGDGTVLTISAEKGYLREVGNLVFHLSLVGLLVAIAVGKLVGYEGSVIVNVGSQFCSTSPASYDNFRPGLLVDGTQLSPFCVDVEQFTASYTDAGQASGFLAKVRSQSGADAGSDRWQSADLQVNDPLRLDGERLYLLGHGFTPHFRITYPDGTVRDYSQPFAPAANDPNFTSEGAVKVLDPPGATGDEVRKQQLAIVGIFAPTATLHGGIMTSSFPAPDNPGVAVDIYRGDLGMEGGRSQSVFSIDTAQVDRGLLTKQARTNLTVGESVTLDDGTSITFTGFNEWVSLQTSFDPAQVWALVFSVTLLVGLMVSLICKRRRVWFRLRPAGGAVHGAGAGESDRAGGGVGVRADRTVVEIGGLARTDQAGYGEEFEKLAGLVEAPDTAGRRR